MIKNIMIIPMPMHHGHTTPMTKEEQHIMFGCFVIMSIIYFIALGYYFYKWYKSDRYDSFPDFVMFESNFFAMFTIMMMTIMYGILILIALGILVSKLLF